MPGAGNRPHATMRVTDRSAESERTAVDAEDNEFVPHPRVLRTVDEWRQIGVPHYWLDKRWRNFIIGPYAEIDSFYCDSPHLPADSGVYFLWGAEWDLCYVGMSTNIQYRMSQHVKARRIPFRYVTHIPMPTDIAKIIERVYIEALTPPHNQKYDWSGWKGHDRMVRLVRRLWHKALRGEEPPVLEVSARHFTLSGV
jgi:hypothetical protein